MLCPPRPVPARPAPLYSDTAGRPPSPPSTRRAKGVVCLSVPVRCCFQKSCSAGCTRPASSRSLQVEGPSSQHPFFFHGPRAGEEGAPAGLWFATAPSQDLEGLFQLAPWFLAREATRG